MGCWIFFTRDKCNCLYDILFSVFWKKLKKPKRHFEINLPLPTLFIFMVFFTGYTLHIRHKYDKKDQISNDQVQVDGSGEQLQYVVTDLKPSVYYQFWVVANSLLGQGNASIIQGYRVARSKHNKGRYTI